MTADRPRERLVVGAMTGTSLDGIDVALVAVRGRGLKMEATLQRHGGRSLGAVGGRLREIADQTPLPARVFAEAARDLGRRHEEAIGDLLGPGGTADLIAVHGQTILHDPPLSWQLIDAAPLAIRFGAPVVSDLRQADLAAGGEGAPITPLADWILFRHPERRRVIVNLGGFCNVTVLPAGREPETIAGIRGFDVCACNHLLDAVARRVLGAPYDDGGAAAARGTAHAALAESLAAQLESATADGRVSLGTGDEMRGWALPHASSLAPADLCATAVEAIAARIAARLAPERADELIVAGGGALNLTLVTALGRRFGAPAKATDELGLHRTAREAVAIAVLGALCADGVPITLPHVTGCRSPAPLAGRWSGGRD